MTVRNVNIAGFRSYAAGKIIIKLPGEISDEKYSSESIRRFGKNNKALPKRCSKGFLSAENFIAALTFTRAATTEMRSG